MSAWLIGAVAPAAYAETEAAASIDEITVTGSQSLGLSIKSSADSRLGLKNREIPAIVHLLTRERLLDRGRFLGKGVLRVLFFSAAFVALNQVAWAQESQFAGEQLDIETIHVYARAERQVGLAAAASAGAVGGADLTTRPMLLVGQLLEVVPGLIAAQHSGSGKANQYFLRGINLDHGTDFTSYFDDVPMNFRSHGHGQGYLDLNGIIPETVERIDYRKGPYRADMGDFALAGAAHMGTVARFDRPFALAEGGNFGQARFVAGGTADAGDGALTGALQFKTYDGPWQLSENAKQVSAYGKYSALLNDTALDISGSGYYGKWRPTEQIPDRAIGRIFSEPGAPTITCADAFCAIDPSARGKTTRFMFSARLTGDAWRATLYAQYYDWHMSSNPTFYLDYPVEGDQIYQHDRRWIFGGRLEGNSAPSATINLLYGVDWRYDTIPDVGTDHSVKNVPVSIIAANSIREASASPYAEATWSPTDRLRVMGGVRAEAYHFSVTSFDPGSPGGEDSDSLLSPKATIAYQASEDFELYANWGWGFHSNDARGVVNTVSPVAGLVKGIGKELGARLQVGELTLTGTYWWLNVGSELKFVGDSNSVEPSDPSARHGYELTFFWRPAEWLAVDGVWTDTRAHFQNVVDDHVPGALENVGEFGASAIFDRYEASARVRYVGAYPLVENNSERAKPTTDLNFRLAWKPTDRLMVYSELLNVLDHQGKHISYFYTSRLPGEPAEGIDGRVSRVEEPRTVRVGVKVNF